MVEGFKSGMTPEDLLVLRMRQLEKKPEDLEHAARKLKQFRIKSKEEFERRFSHRIHKEDYKPGDFILLRNSRFENSLDKKSKPRYLGPYEVLRKTKGGSYVVMELSGQRKITAQSPNKMIPYVARDKELLRHLTIDSDNEESDSEKPELTYE